MSLPRVTNKSEGPAEHFDSSHLRRAVLLPCRLRLLRSRLSSAAVTVINHLQLPCASSLTPPSFSFPALRHTGGGIKVVESTPPPQKKERQLMPHVHNGGRGG